MAGKSDNDTEKLDKPSAEPEEPTCEATACIPQVQSDITVKKVPAENSNTDHQHHTEKFKCNQCDYEDSSEKGLTQHVHMKHCPVFSLDALEMNMSICAVMSS